MDNLPKLSLTRMLEKRWTIGKLSGAVATREGQAHPTQLSTQSPTCRFLYALSRYPFTEPKVKPRMKYRWKNTNTSSVGMLAYTAIADCTP